LLATTFFAGASEGDPLFPLSRPPPLPNRPLPPPLSQKGVSEHLGQVSTGDDFYSSPTKDVASIGLEVPNFAPPPTLPWGQSSWPVGNRNAVRGGRLRTCRGGLIQAERGRRVGPFMQRCCKNFFLFFFFFFFPLSIQGSPFSYLFSARREILPSYHIQWEPGER